MKSTPVRVAVSVGVPPARAFAMFVNDIGRWWKKDTTHWIRPEKATEMRIEPRVGGRWIEVHDPITGEGIEIGRVTSFEPGKRIKMAWRLPFWEEGADSDLEIVFTPLGADGTKVEVIHDLSRARLEADRHASYDRGWTTLLGYYCEYEERITATT